MSKSPKFHLTRLIPACVLIASTGAFSACASSDDGADQAGSTTPSSETEQVDDASSAPSPEAELEVDAATGDESLIADAFAGKGTIRCTFEQEGHPGTAYIKGKAHLRMDVNSPQGEMHMLKLDRTVYMWGGGLPQGIKFDGQPLNESFATQFDEFTPEEFEKKAAGDELDCAEYSGDDSMFDVPGDVTFMIPGMGQAGG